MKNILFLCTGNSCRSQIAEAIVNQKLSESWQAFSAGTHPTGEVHTMALTVLKEIGIIHEGRSKSVNEFIGQSFDLVITVCDDAAEDCPVWLGSGIRQHVSFIDPANATGSYEEKLTAFRQVRDQINEKILPILVRQN